MRAKKSVFLILIVSLLAVLVGCGKKPVGEERVTIRWCVDNAPSRKAQVEAFEEAYPDIKVNLDFVASKGRMLTQIAGGTPPDVFPLYSLDDFIIFAKKDILLDITDYVKEWGIDMSDFWPQYLPAMVYEGRIYGFVENAGSMVFFYNKKMFDEAGVSYPTDNWRWEDVLEAAKKLTKKDPSTGRHIQFGIDSWIQEPFFIFWQNGGSIFNQEGTKCIINSPQNKEALQFFYDLQFKYHVSPTSLDRTGIQASSGWAGNLFEGGKAAMIICGRWMLMSFRRNKELEFDIAPLPYFKERATIIASKTYSIPKSSKHIKEALKFLRFRLNKENQLIVARTGDGIPSLRSVANSKEFLFNPDFPNETRNYLFLEEMKYARPMEVSKYISGFDFRRIWYEETEKMWIRKQSPSETLDRIAERVNSIMRKRYLEMAK
ncbi:MAG: putative ABC transporter substrate-binding protein YesO [candidate division WS2 bacterium]|nr:putative ABC transporter substrate-binding protein YesO [Candidatus Psychracetigena formicireducens]